MNNSQRLTEILKNTKAVIFDNDGVVVDSEHLHFKVNHDAFLEHGYELSEREYIERYIIKGTSSPGLIKDNGLNVDYEELVRVKAESYRHLCKSYLHLMPGVLSLIDSAYQYFPLAVASASHTHDVITALESFYLRNRFKVVLGAEDVDEVKPNPECYLKAASLLGVNPKHCLVFEDTERGLKAAKAAGMYCVVNPNQFIAKYFEEDYSKADLVVKDFIGLELVPVKKRKGFLSFFLPRIRYNF